MAYREKVSGKEITCPKCESKNAWEHRSSTGSGVTLECKKCGLNYQSDEGYSEAGFLRELLSDCLFDLVDLSRKYGDDILQIAYENLEEFFTGGLNMGELLSHYIRNNTPLDAAWRNRYVEFFNEAIEKIPKMTIEEAKKEIANKAQGVV